VSEQPGVRTFYRIAKRYPPGDDEYVTAREKYGDPDPNLPPAVQRSYDGYSFYNTVKGARGQAKRARGKLGWLILRYDIPSDAAVTWVCDDTGHCDLFGDRTVLKTYLVGIAQTIDPPESEAKR
jgi:hypothetical protein